MTAVENKSDEVKAKGDVHWVTWIASAFSGLMVVLLLLGYGATLGIESSTGLPHAAMIDSPADLIELASLPLIEFVFVFGEALTSWSTFERLYSAVWMSTLGLSIIFLIMFILGYAWRIFKNRKIEGAVSRSKHGMKKVDEKHSSVTWKHWKSYLQLQSFLLALPLLLLSGMAVVLYCVVLIGIIPIFGMQATNAYFKNWVVEPEICIPPRNNESREKVLVADANGKKKGASCVKVTKDERFLGDGRVVLSTSKAIVLYRPQDGAVKRIPLDGAVIELVPKLSD